ncbi:MAG: hypothetical protein U0894_09780 [Pirellulales bacterium]
MRRKQAAKAFAELLKKYQPQIVVVMIGTNDAAGNVSSKDFQGSMEKMRSRLLCSACGAGADDDSSDCEYANVVMRLRRSFATWRSSRKRL